MKFKKNDSVSINFSAFCSAFVNTVSSVLEAHNDEAETEPVEYHKVLNCRMTDTGIEYKLRGCYGWWKEEHLSLKPEEPKFSPSRDEAQGPNTLQAESLRRDTGENIAVWMWSEVSSCYVCSNCERSALNDYKGDSTDSQFCPHCGRRMTNSTIEED